MDITRGFFQQPIHKEDRWKTAFVTPYREHEVLIVFTNVIATQSSQPPSQATPLATNILINIVVHLIIITHLQ